MSFPTQRRCALLPLGSAQGEDALDVWEHIAFSEWLEAHARPGDALREQVLQRLFEEETAYWEACVFWGPVEETTFLDRCALEEDDSCFADLDVSQSYED
jgi:hypothetical protein